MDNPTIVHYETMSTFSPPSPGTVSYMVELDDRCEGKTGMDYVVARLEALNFTTCWATEESQKKLWPMVNRHLWRIQAMYHGGDCFLAGWNNAVPHQRLYSSPTLGQKHALPAHKDTGYAL